MDVQDVLGETHNLIAENIARELHLDKRSKDLLTRGSLAPDILRDHPHHTGNEYNIISHLANAVRYFQEGNDECYVELGKAMHCIQDRWVSRREPLHVHSGWEQRINESPILNYKALIQHIKTCPFPLGVKEYYEKLVVKISLGVGAVSLFEYDTLHPQIKHHMNSETFVKISYFALAWSHPKSASGEPYSTPIIDLNIAYMICLQIARCILSSFTDWKNPPVSISELEAKKATLKKMGNNLWVLGRLLYTYIKSVSLLVPTSLLFFSFANFVLFAVGINLPEDRSTWGLVFALFIAPFFIGILVFSGRMIGGGRDFKFVKDLFVPSFVSAFVVQTLYLFHPYGLVCLAIQHYLLVPTYFVYTRMKIIKRALNSLRTEVPHLEEEIRRRLEEEKRQGITVMLKGKGIGK